METLTRAELLEQIVFMKRHMNRADVEQIIDRFFLVITNRLASGEVVRISGLGNFMLLDKDERPGRNPKTGESIPVSSRRVVTFKPGNKLKSTVASFSNRDVSSGRNAVRRVKKSQPIVDKARSAVKEAQVEEEVETV